MRFAYLFASNLLYYGAFLFLYEKKSPYQWADVTDFGLTLGYVVAVMWLIFLLVSLVFHRLLRLAAQVHRVYLTNRYLGQGLVFSTLLLNAFLLTNVFGLVAAKYLVLVVIKASWDTCFLLSCKRLNPFHILA
jgi:hypothetical protein